MAVISEINGKAGTAISAVSSKTYVTVVRQVDGQDTKGVLTRGSNIFTASGTSGTTTLSATIIVVGQSATFSAFATVSLLSVTVNTSVTLNGTNRTATRNTIGTTASATFVLTPGTYTLTGTVSFTGSGGFGSGGLQWTQP